MIPENETDLPEHQIELRLEDHRRTCNSFAELSSIDTGKRLLTGGAEVLPLDTDSHIWRVYSVSIFDDTEEQWNSIVEKIGDHWEEFMEIAAECTVSITLFLNIDGYFPRPFIPLSLSHTAAKLNAIISVEYCSKIYRV